MDFKEFIKGFVAEDKLEELLNGMKDNKFFLASEENLDTRYSKLKGDFDALTKKSGEDNKLIEDLKKSSKDNQDMQAKFTEYDGKLAQLEAENQQLKIDSALKVALLGGKAKQTDLDYLMYKIKQENKELKLDDNGELKGFDVKDIKTAYPSNFEVESKKEVDINNLPNIKDPKAETITKEQFDKMGYSSKVELKKENPEMYNALAKKN